MLLAGMSFIQHYRLWVEWRPRSFFRDVEVRGYLLVVVAATALISPILLLRRRATPRPRPSAPRCSR